MSGYEGWILFFAGGVLILLVLWICYQDSREKDPRNSRENYDFLGSLAPNKKAYVRCIQECERQDPSLRLGPGNVNCVQKCNILFGEAAARGIRVEAPKNNIEVCQEKCAHPNPEMKDKCVSRCSCHREVVDYCDRVLCPHSSGNRDECMKGCVAREIVNCNNTSWTWKTIR